jgi:2-hydroxychromene-2-carboxylate isomerase
VKVQWLFDLISPFAYLSFHQLQRLPPDVTVELVPVLFAGLLQQHGQIGPAEIAPKRRFTYRYVLWRARRLQIPLRMPPAHPFNPLHALRLVVAAGSTRDAVATAFDFVFGQGRDVSDAAVLAELAHALGVEKVPIDARVKDQLRAYTDRAISQGVFGVPTFLAGRELFWGHDSLEMLLDYLHDPVGFEDAQMQSLERLPIGVRRSRTQRN